MGYFKDNFPGSAAQLQRQRIAKGVVAYALLAGSAIFFFSPFSKSLKQEIEKGSWSNPEWYEKRRYIFREGFIKTEPYLTREKFEESFEQLESQERHDFTSPILYRKTEAYLRTPDTTGSASGVESATKKQ